MKPQIFAPLLLTLTFTATLRAEPTWEGDFETGDLSQWSYLLNEEGLSVVSDPVQSGMSAGRIEITKDNLWSNGLNRVEFQHKPKAELIAEGGSVYFGWSVFLPETLTQDDHQIGYWETDVTYQQVMSLHARGEDLSFNSNSPFNLHWQGEGLLTAEQWHRIVYHVQWSGDAASGRVSLWFDGQKVVDEAAAKTYLGNPAFIQLGILRDTIDDVEVMVVDDALEGSTFEDVAMLDDFPPVETPAAEDPMDTPEAEPTVSDSPSTVSDPPSTASDATAQPASGDVTDPPKDSTASPAADSAAKEKSSSSCAMSTRSSGSLSWLSLALGSLLLGGRRRLRRG